MNYIEKLRELHPDWSEWEFGRKIVSDCPYTFFKDAGRPCLQICTR